MSGAGNTRKADDSQHYYLEKAEVDEESDGGFPYEEVNIDDDDAVEPPPDDEDLNTALRTLKEAEKKLNAAESGADTRAAPKAPKLTREPEVVDDFITNFLNKMGMKNTLAAFQNEWYELQQRGRINREELEMVPGVYQQNQLLDNNVRQLQRQVENEKEQTTMVRSTWEKLTQERNYHRMHHRRVEQEKQSLLRQLKELRKLQETFEPALEQLDRKHKAALKEANSRGRKIQALKEIIERQKTTIAQLRGGAGASDYGGGDSTARDTSRDLGPPMRGGGEIDNPYVSGDERPAPASAIGSARQSTAAASRGPRRPAGPPMRSARTARSVATDGTRKRVAVETNLALEDFPNPNLDKRFEPVNATSISSVNSLNAHQSPISALATHPSQAMVAAVSDDASWSLWTIHTGELIMRGVGHKDWVGCVDFSPKGTQLITGSGDGTIWLWDILKLRHTATFAEHSMAVWGVSFHAAGDVFASCSMDTTIRCWDITTSKSQLTLRGHVNSVNSCAFVPYSGLICSGSADHTVSLWDTRTGRCTHTFFGHEAAVNHVTFNLQGTTLATSDADGTVVLWDVRTQRERDRVVVGSGDSRAANDVSFDRSGRVLAVACEDGFMKMYDTDQRQIVNQLAHDGPVQAVAFDTKGLYLLSAGAAGVVKIWNV